MNILLIGQGGREHALAYKIAQSPLCETLYVATGNPGTAQIATNVNVQVADFKEVIKFVQEKRVGLVVVGPEQPLVEGLADALRAEGIKVVGPGRAGADLEGSKEFAKQFMQRNGVSTARFRHFHPQQIVEAKAYAASLGFPVVIKASGLAAGKGVIISTSQAETDECITGMLSGNWFGEAGTSIVVEEFLAGIEVSVFVLTDGNDYLLLPAAKDYKRIGEGDKGLNTGGMGAVSPVPFLDDTLMQKITVNIIKPTLNGLRNEQIPYCGFIFLGVMVVAGEPYLLEYNCRMGDPETEVVIPRLKSDLVDLCLAACEGKLSTKQVEIDERACATVMLVSQGYPGSYEKGKVITGLETLDNPILFHAGTSTQGGQLLTNGGRVLAVGAYGHNLQAALNRAFSQAEAIHFEGKYYRRDIGRDVLGNA